MSLTLTEADKLKNKVKKSKLVETYKDFLGKPITKSNTKPRKSNYSKQRSWWENR